MPSALRHCFDTAVIDALAVAHVVAPLAYIPAIYASIDYLTGALPAIVQPFAFIDIAVGVVHFAMATLTPILDLPFVSLTISKQIYALLMINIIVPLADINTVIRTDHHADALSDHIVEQFAPINRSILVCDSLYVVFAGNEH